VNSRPFFVSPVFDLIAKALDLVEYIHDAFLDERFESDDGEQEASILRRYSFQPD
jgi:hypothetical protein